MILKKRIISIIVCSFFSITLANCDPGWNYIIKSPPVIQARNHQIIKYENFIIKVKSYYFSMGSEVILSITTDKMKQELYPVFAYTESMIDKSKKRIPYDCTVSSYIQDSIISERHYRFNLGGNSIENADTGFSAWNRGIVKIVLRNGSIIRTVSKETIPRLTLLSRGQVLDVHFRFIGYNLCGGSITPENECQDFIFYYTLLQNKRPLKIEFRAKVN